MVVGSNERLYPWMDEGFNTFMDLENAALYFKGSAYGDTIEVHPLRLYPTHATAGEQPLIERPVAVRDLFWVGYQKPAMVMRLLREEVLGRERFDYAFREYIRAWQFRHPTPADFFRIMRDASGMDLDWFWRGWVTTAGRLDQAVDSVSRGADGTRIHLSSRAANVMPMEMELTWSDGSTERVRLPVEMWNQGPRFSYRVRGPKALRRVVVDPRGVLPDERRGNNRWPR
jgi:aminopeptidase N